MSVSSRLDELKKRYDENPRRFFAPLANEYRKAGELDLAIGLCERHLSEQPTNMNGHVVYGQALFEAGRHDDARATFGTALSLDPENLIALRHLGDIARMHGDTAGARDWFRRILDADPRNDEIIGFLAELDAAALVENKTPHIPMAAIAPDPRGAKTVEIVAPPRPEPPPSAEESALATEIFGDAATLAFERPVVPSRESVSSMPLLDLPDFDTSLGTAAVTPDAEPVAELPPALSISEESSSFEPQASYEAADTPVFGFETTSVTEQPIFGADVPAPEPFFGADPPAPEPLFGADSPAPDPFFVDDTPSPDLVFVTDEPEVAPPIVPDELVLSEPTLGEPTLSERPTQPFSQPAVIPTVEDFTEATLNLLAEPMDELSEGTPAAVAPLAAPFVTATMAELFLQQGHPDRALEVYQQLAAQRPDDEALKMRIRALMPTPIIPTRTQEFAVPTIEPSAVARPEVRSVPLVGPTAREFFAALASRGVSVGAATAPAEPNGETVWTEGPIDRLFAGAPIAEADEAAARMFALYLYTTTES